VSAGGPEPPSRVEIPPSGAFSTATLVMTAFATFLIGLALGVGLTLVLRPAAPAPVVEETAEVEDEPEAEASASASAVSSAEAPPPVDAAAQARFRKLQELRKKIKGQRSKQMDAQCAKQFKTKYPAGYVYSGGRFEENELVANASGCVALAKSTKAPWFCCPR
jgi:hypothetical protein